ncbi:hypothetical protein [Pseudomonas piscis]|uniref:hypothetical protein n=1 Tax=Pseudomonas piscis TaxID=2614538 RepID=UPI0021D5F582|nr:hypothetical protein [Pseudomonas piscis]MCU7645630.1 hypothetical protein [Pseudomonas piscis]
MTGYTELNLLIDRVLNDRRFCSDENHRILALGSKALIAENERQRKNSERYLFLRDRCGLVAYQAIAGSIGPGMLPSGDALEVAIDAVMGKGASHG